MAILKRPMFRKGGSANEGIMDGLDRKGYDNGGKIEPFNALTADTYGSPYYDNEVIMENLRRFQELGMGNPYKELSGRAGFDNMWDFITRPAEHDIFRKIYDAAPIVKKKKAAKKAMETATQLSPYKKYFASDMGIDYTTPPDVNSGGNDDGDIDGLSTNDVKTILADKKTMLSDRAKEFAELLSPGAQKRAIYDSLAAASESFGKSTGNTRQDIANAISAAAKGMGGATDTYQKARLLAIEEDIKKGIAEAGKADYKPNATEALINYLEDSGMSKKEVAAHLTSKSDIDRIITLSDKYVADPNAIGKGMGDNFKLKSIEAGGAANNYGGSLPDKTVKKEVVEDFDKMEKGLIYFNPLDLKFYSLDEKGEPIQVPKPKYLK